MKQPELGKKITELRMAKGLTQEELVQLCNVSVRTIQRIESGEVTPRSYTVKTILAALNYDLGKISASNSENEDSSSWLKNLFFAGTDVTQPSEFVVRQLNLAWIFGIGYFVLGFLEGPAEYFRFATDDMIFGDHGYVVIKVLVLVAYIFFQRGFFVIGSLFDNYLLKIISVVLIGLMTLVQGFEIVSVYNDSFDAEALSLGASLSFGAIGIVYGIALIRLNASLGVISLLTGAFEIIASMFFLTIVLSFIGFIVLTPAELLEIILLYKAVEIVKGKATATNFA